MQMTYVIDEVAIKRLMLDRWGAAEQKKLAKVTGLSEGTIVRLFQGHGFSPESLYQLCQTLECEPNDILKVAPKKDLGSRQ